MDRSGAVTRLGREQGRDGADAAGETPRGAAIEALRRALEAADGPVLLTGEPGVGKTWVTERLARGLGHDWRWLVLDMTPALDPRDFYELIRHGLGLTACPEPGLAGARLALEGVLVEAAAEGVRWALVVEEAHNASDAILEEVRVLGNRLGRPTGFGGILLVGQNALVRRLLTRPLSPLAARLAARVHLRALDSDERVPSPRAAAAATAAEGAARPRAVRSDDGPIETPAQPGGETAPAAASAVALETTTAANGPGSSAWPSAVPRPPLVIGEGMVEVGWEPVPDASEGYDTNEPASPAASNADEDAAGVQGEDDGAATDEPVRDHYAALQAWAEWSRREGRGVHDKDATGDTPEGETDAAGEANEREPVGSEGTIWADGRHGFAPYGPLFSRPRHAPGAP